MVTNINIFSSNQIERLYPKLKEELFSESSTSFTKRTIIVPSPAMKAWLSIRFANDPEVGIAMGFKILNLDGAINAFIEQYGLDEKSRSQPIAHYALALHVERVIREVIAADLKPDEKLLWKPLLEYLHTPVSEKSSLSKKSNRRITAMSDKLASLFQQYDRYGLSLLNDWTKLQHGGWQGEIWRRTVGTPPSFPQNWKSTNAQIHLFGLSFLSRQQHQFFQRIAQAIPVHYYLLSPCQAFWSDLLSDRESSKLQKYWEKKGISDWQTKELEDYLYDRNALLANFGRLGREMSHMLEESDATISEEYVLPQSALEHSQYADLANLDLIAYKTNAPFSLLEAIQTDLLLLRNPLESEKIKLQDKTKTIQVHAAPTLMREMQILYNNLLDIISRHANDKNPLHPGDIIVMGPDIMAYEPYIRAVFEGKNSSLPCQIMDLHMLARNQLVQGYLHLLSLPESRWDSISILRLLDFTPFQRKHRLRAEDIRIIRSWVKDGDARWGEDSNHRNEMLKSEHCLGPLVDNNPTGTWQFAMDRLLLGIAMAIPEEDKEDDEMEALPAASIDISKSDLLGKWLELLQSLREDLKPLSDGSMFALKDWTSYLEQLLESYFELDEEDEKNEEAENSLLNIIQSLSLGEAPANTEFPFTTIYHHLKSLIDKQRVCYRENDLQAVRFCSMLPMRAVPAKVIALVGMQEDSYPRKDSSFSLNLMNGYPGVDYCPSQRDFDRYLFLEMLLSCRSYFLMSYVGTSKDGNEQSPSLLIEEILSYVDKGYTIDGEKPSQCIAWKHPFRSFDKSYFQLDTHFKWYSKSDYKAAKAFYCGGKETKYSFVPKFTFGSAETGLRTPKTALQINLSKLAALARNPIQSYFNNTLGIYLDKEEMRSLKSDEEFLISALDAATIRNKSLSHPVDRVLRIAEKQGKLPLGPFKNIVKEKLVDESGEISVNLEKMGVHSSHIFHIEFSDRYHKPHKTETGWQLPPLELIFKGEIPIQIIGKIKTAAPEGLVAMAKDSQVDALKHWPQFLACSCLARQYGLPIKDHVLFARSGKMKSAFFEDPKVHFEKFLEYYFLAAENISPLIPEWVPEFLSGDQDKLAAKIQSNLSVQSDYFYNDYVKWMYRHGGSPVAQEILSGWKEYANELYGELHKQWYPL